MVADPRCAHWGPWAAQVGRAHGPCAAPHAPPPPPPTEPAGLWVSWALLVSVDESHVVWLVVLASSMDVAVLATTAQKSRFWAATRAPPEQPKHPHLPRRAVYQLLVRQSKACWRAVMRSVRSAHAGKASRGACTSCRTLRARVPYPPPTSAPAHTTMWLPGSPQLPEAHTTSPSVPDTIPQG